MEKAKIVKIPETTNSGKETRNTKLENSFANPITAILIALSNFAESIDRLSLSTKLILLILALSIVAPISLGVAIRLIISAITCKGG
jgi:hypothetical protein